ncbi:hypothetical protein MLD38_010031 [Melastoma candidum]|uniref:Uncharacterized protein n=1 Tax=Melastoma candidum TaxID=119954 RepID=A0ACB9QYL2_9MYRT|nr:hypothetical protein MLD38_010031 [Melastoma candidum]
MALQSLLRLSWGVGMPPRAGHDVFLSHRRIDTRRTVAALLHDRLTRLGLTAFLDSKSMIPGDRLLERIDAGILDCRVGVAIFSPRYCDSYYCLHELALMMEARKKVIPIFCNVKPAQLRVSESVICSIDEARRFDKALDEAKNIVGITFDSMKEDWLELLKSASDVIMQEFGRGS